MSVNKNVFASKSERGNYYKLRRTWGDKYAIYHNLPFLNIFGTTGLVELWNWPDVHEITLTDIEIARLKKTSVDFTLCDGQDCPLLCIEFDGLQQGFSVGAAYYPDQILPGWKGVWRREITELKLKVAMGSLFPFFVVGSKQFEDIHPDAKLTIVDGIIGSVLASKATADRLLQGPSMEDLGVSQQEFDELSEAAQFELAQDWALGVEVQNDMELNPVIRRRWNLQASLGSRGYWSELLTYPSIEDGLDFKDRAKAIDNAILHGEKFTVKTDDFGEIETTVWLPNFKAFGFPAYSILEEIAGLLALEKLKSMRESKKY